VHRDSGGGDGGGGDDDGDDHASLHTISDDDVHTYVRMYICIHVHVCVSMICVYMHILCMYMTTCVCHQSRGNDTKLGGKWAFYFTLMGVHGRVGEPLDMPIRVISTLHE
jgi:hypothetical protein